jgi:molecular chaperone GrpE
MMPHLVREYRQEAQSDNPGAPADPQPASPDAEQAQRAVQEEIEDLKNRLKRLSADYQNYAMRSRQEAQRAREQAVGDFARALVGVMDHFDLAVAVDVSKVDAAGVLQGVRIVRDALLATLGQFGVRRVEAAVGQPFDPSLHQAMTRQNVQGLPPQHIASQFQPGYTLDGRTLRPAAVAVSE